MAVVAAYGQWPSPLRPRDVAGARVAPTGLQQAAGALWWSEPRPAEGGRQTVLRALLGGYTPEGWPAVHAPLEVTLPPANVRTRVHEYGGGAWTVSAEGGLLYSELADQALWWLEPAPAGGGWQPAVRVTPPAPPGEEHRYGDLRLVPGVPWAVAVRERHRQGAADEELVAVHLGAPAAVAVLAAGRDFYAAPRPSPDGRMLAYVCWDHPRMPWDGSELWVGALHWDRPGGPVLAGARQLAGGPAESVGQPTWAAGPRRWTLWFVSDRDGWWQPWSWEETAAAGSATPRRRCATEAEFHSPDWVLGQQTLVPLPGAALACRFRHGGRDRIGVVDPRSGALVEVDQPVVSISAVCALDGSGPSPVLAVAGATASEPPAVHMVRLPGGDGGAGGAGRHVVVHRPVRPLLPASAVSVAQHLAFPAGGGVEGHLLFYPPRGVTPEGEALVGPTGTRPPVVVWVHGGPTAVADPGFEVLVQFWTTRGVAVAAVDYRGSAGYGRAYRQLLDGQWGVADAEDCVAAARFLAGTGLVDGTRMAVRGSSAGGFTALRAARPDGPFAAAVVLYPVTDLRALAASTHRFEAHYTDRLVGPLPAAAARYEERSPACHPEDVGVPVLLLQGEDDTVVPPDQAARLVAALTARGIRCEHVRFPGEGHGFRRAETLDACARLELRFLREVLGFGAAT